jgi:uncharacterized protein YjbJ (UPF0337 family)
MNWLQVKGHWKELEGLVRGTWGELTDDDLVAAEGQAELLVGRVMARYGLSREAAERQVASWADRMEEQLDAMETSLAPEGPESGEEARPLGRRRWAIAEGYIPGWIQGPRSEFEGHETACLLNTSDAEAHVALTVFFKDREPAGPYMVKLGPRRTLHLRYNELSDPEPIPRGVDYASVIESDVPIVVQHTRVDMRQVSNPSTVAYSE